ncbi:MAG: hypothetical protein C0601_11815 [Candidatus Muiribacterium halophilum]|uniref:Secondary thiamine-phosphate synthase enzyme n=1 Tax=Muiribacterium halophilum TaxID=2053465 RepID=A0A2N5ZBC1_MUIH1|nr:MAG: hypothetical protein C0601_11815 [Candidatus Muirbacterium halophilum]
MFYEHQVQTNKRVELYNITTQVKSTIKDSGVKEGICHIFVPHTTAAVTINENADPAVKGDITNEMNKVIPFSDNYQHAEGNSAAHIKASLFGFSETVIIKNGNPVLGTWQDIYFAEFDGPRRRRFVVKVIEG